MVDSLRGTDARVAMRRTLSADAMAALEDLLHDAPPASGAHPRSAG
jgi:hypothetical protein